MPAERRQARLQRRGLRRVVEQPRAGRRDVGDRRRGDDTERRGPRDPRRLVAGDRHRDAGTAERERLCERIAAIDQHQPRPLQQGHQRGGRHAAQQRQPRLRRDRHVERGSADHDDAPPLRRERHRPLDELPRPDARVGKGAAAARHDQQVEPGRGARTEQRRRGRIVRARHHGVEEAHHRPAAPAQLPALQRGQPAGERRRVGDPVLLEQAHPLQPEGLAALPAARTDEQHARPGGARRLHLPGAPRVVEQHHARPERGDLGQHLAGAARRRRRQCDPRIRAAADVGRLATDEEADLDPGPAGVHRIGDREATGVFAHATRAAHGHQQQARTGGHPRSIWNPRAKHKFRAPGRRVQNTGAARPDRAPRLPRQTETPLALAPRTASRLSPARPPCSRAARRAAKRDFLFDVVPRPASSSRSACSTATSPSASWR